MIAKIYGTVDELKPTETLINVNGVCYGLSIPLSTYEKIQNKQDVMLFVHTYHKEDVLHLYGFFTSQEKEIFKELLHVSGIGPQMALSIISSLSVEEFINAIKVENIGLLTKVPGIGKSKGEKLIFDLKRKLKKLEHLDVIKDESSIKRNDAINALHALGFDEYKSAQAVSEVLKNDDVADVESIIKKSLQLLSG